MHALHYANELLLRSRLAFQKLLQTLQTSRNYHKEVLVMIKHCLGNSQINSIPAWSKEFSYITFLYRTLAKVYALARADIIHLHYSFASFALFIYLMYYWVECMTSSVISFACFTHFSNLKWYYDQKNNSFFIWISKLC